MDKETKKALIQELILFGLIWLIVFIRGSLIVSGNDAGLILTLFFSFIIASGIWLTFNLIVGSIFWFIDKIIH